MLFLAVASSWTDRKYLDRASESGWCVLVFFLHGT